MDLLIYPGYVRDGLLTCHSSPCSHMYGVGIQVIHKLCMETCTQLLADNEWDLQ